MLILRTILNGLETSIPYLVGNQMISCLMLLYVAAAVLPDDRPPVVFKNGRIVVRGEFDVAAGELIEFQVLMECTNGFLSTLNPQLSPEYRAYASVEIFSKDYQLLDELVADQPEAPLPEQVVLIRHRRSVGRAFRIATGSQTRVDSGDLQLAVGEYFLQVCYFDGLLKGSSNPTKLLCRSKFYKIRVR